MASPASTRKISCDFFQVNLGQDGKTSFIKTVNAIYKNNPSIKNRNVQIDDDYMRIHDWSVTGKDARGALLRLRVRNDANVGFLDLDDLRSLELQKGEVLTEYYGFRYFGQFNVLVVHRNRDAGSISRLENYLGEMHLECRPAVMSHIPASDPWKRMDELRSINVVEVTIARPKSLRQYQNSGLSTQKIAGLTSKMTSESGAEYLTLRFSMGHKKGTLSAQVKEFLHEVRDLGIVRSASVHGKQVYTHKQAGLHA